MPPFVEINIFKGERPRKRRQKQLLIQLFNFTILKFMNLNLKVDKGPVTGRLIVKDQNGNDLSVIGASYTSENESVFTVTGDDGSFTLTPTGEGAANFNYSANGLSGSGVITIEPAAAVATTIDFELLTTQPE